MATCSLTADATSRMNGCLERVIIARLPDMAGTQCRLHEGRRRSKIEQTTNTLLPFGPCTSSRTLRRCSDHTSLTNRKRHTCQVHASRRSYPRSETFQNQNPQGQKPSNSKPTRLNSNRRSSGSSSSSSEPLSAPSLSDTVENPRNAEGAGSSGNKNKASQSTYSSSSSSSSRSSSSATSSSSSAAAAAADPGPPSFLVILFRRVVRQLSSLPLAIGLLFAIAGMSAIGTVIPQGDPYQDYVVNYPEDNPVLGFLSWRLIFLLGWDHLYSSPLFVALLSLLAACLASCSSSRQWPMLKVAQRWSFINRPETILSMEVSDSLERARLADLALILSSRGYEVFKKGDTLYAFKGLVGRLAPIAVHASMLVIMAGGCYSAFGGWQGTTMTPQGLDIFVPSAMYPNSQLARPTSNMNLVVHVDKFFIDYRPSGEVKQFYTDLSVYDFAGRNLLTETISVNHPLRCQGVTIYQTDWAISGIQLRVLNGQNEVFNLPMADLQEPGDSAKLYGTFLPKQDQEGEGRTKGISLLAQDFQNVILYDSSGQFVGVRRPGSKKPIEVDGMQIVVEDLIGATGLELKVDYGVPYVYAGFGGLMITTFISYLSHSQVWALQVGSTLYIGGKSNRAKFGFKEEIDNVLNSVPEVVSTSKA